MRFEKCDIPENVKIRGYGDNQKLVSEFAESSFECAKVLGFYGKINSLVGRLNIVAKNLNLPQIRAFRRKDEVFLINTLYKKED